MPVCVVKFCIKAVKLGLSSIVQTWIGPLSVLVDEVFVEPPQPAVHKATATRPMAVMCFLNAPFIEPPPRLRSHLTAPVTLAGTGYGTGYGEYSTGAWACQGEDWYSQPDGLRVHTATAAVDPTIPANTVER